VVLDGGSNLGQGRSIAAPGRFVDDDGSADDAIRYAASANELLSALKKGRLLVAVMPAAAPVDDALSSSGEDKSSDMSVVSMVAADGRRGLLVFSGIDALRRWDSSARPVPVASSDAARAAIDDGCEALVLDVAGPRSRVVTESDLVALAGIDAMDYAKQVVQTIMGTAFGENAIVVEVVGTRLRLGLPASALDAEAVIARITPRVLALVPEGVEITYQQPG
jgi:hypothetical protein